MNKDFRYCALPNGRRLAYAEWGAPDGTAVLYCHGFPGSRLEAQLADVTARRLGVRLIAPDRPGFGASDPHPGRGLADWPADLAALADHQGLEQFHLLGVSGGGPYALACAESMQDRLRAVGIVCGLGRLDDPGATAAMAWPERLGIGFYRRLPGTAAWFYSKLAGPLFRAQPAAIYHIMTTHIPPVEEAVLSVPETRAAILASMSEAFRQGGTAAAWELGIYTRPWPIDLHRIRTRIQLWHGELDTIVPVSMGRAHAATLPVCDARFLPDEGHFSLMIRHMEPILRTLVAI